MFFWRVEAPAQRAVGDCPPLKELPERGPAAGAFLKKINLISNLKMMVEREIHDLKC